MSQVRGTLYTVSAPSGAGKTSLVEALVAVDKLLRVSVSHTTRDKRPGEEDGVNYHFVDQAAFKEMIKAGDFLEYATVFGNSYGTSKQWVNEQLELGFDVILEIDWQGAQIAHSWLAEEQDKPGVGIFILPPSLAELRSRLTERGQDEQQIITERMNAALDEINHFEQADYIVINNDFDVALDDLTAIFRSNRLNFKTQQDYYSALVSELMAK